MTTRIVLNKHFGRNIIATWIMLATLCPVHKVLQYVTVPHITLHAHTTFRQQNTFITFREREWFNIELNIYSNQHDNLSVNITFRDRVDDILFKAAVTTFVNHHRKEDIQNTLTDARLLHWQLPYYTSNRCEAALSFIWSLVSVHVINASPIFTLLVVWFAEKKCNPKKTASF